MSHPLVNRNRNRILVFVLTLAILAATAVSLPIITRSASAGSRPTVYVSLTWDDGRASQSQSVALQQAHGMPATYYINSGLIDSSGYYLSNAGLDAIAAVSGNEIGGHTRTHENLTTLSLADARAAVCEDRAALTARYGDPAGRSFAYPFGANNPDLEKIVKDCGYSSARTVTGVTSPTGCLSCLPAESLPPADPYRLAVPTSVGSSTTLTDLQFQVDQASANGGGWVIYTMHDIGVSGSLWNIDPALYTQFLDWLASRSDVQVRTVGDLMGQSWPTPTNTNTSPQTAPILTPIAMRNADLEADVDRNGIADCWLRGAAGTNTATWTRTTDAHSGIAAEQVTISAYTSGDRKIVPTLDAGTVNGGCAPSVDDTHAYRLSSWYRSTQPVNFVVFLRDAAGAWKYWRTGPSTPMSATWSMTSWDTPQVPTGTTAMSFGLLISGVGTLTTDDAALASISPAAPAVVDPMILNSSLENDVNADGVPDCWFRGGYGINNATFSRVADAHSGSWGERLVVSSSISGDRKLLPTLDNGQGNGGCAPAAKENTRFRLGAWYRSDVVVQLIAYYRDAAGVWHWWFSSSFGPSIIDWMLASKVTPLTPTGTTAISFGLALPTTGTLVTDDYAAAPVI
jgi:peptidoglycan/xylan/chitin deacetylase (PgdA/CDA1 family)